MAEAQRKLPRTEEINEAIIAKLQVRGYTQNEADAVLGFARQLLAGKKVTLDPVEHARIDAGDINAVAGALREVKSKPADFKSIVATELSVRGPQTGQRLSEAQKPVPVKTFMYDVVVEHRTYRVELNRELKSAGQRDLAENRIGQLNQALRGEASPVIAITNGGQTVDKQQFRAVYSTAYSRMEDEIRRGLESDRITVSGNLKKKEG